MGIEERAYPIEVAFVHGAGSRYTNTQVRLCSIDRTRQHASKVALSGSDEVVDESQILHEW